MSSVRARDAFSMLVGGLAAAVLAVTACASDDSPVTPPAPDAGATEDAGAGDAAVETESSCTPRSGTRLKRRWLASDDGARVFDGMYDSSLESTCSFYRTSDGKYRCLPFRSTSTLRYLDDQCTQPVLQNFDSSFDACPLKKYVGGEDEVEDSCDYRTRAFEVGAKLPAGGAYFRKSEGGCVANFPSTEDFYALTPVADDNFVEAVRGSVKGPRLESETYEGVDGSRQCASGFRDVTLGVSVTPEKTTDSKERYIPFSAATVGFADGTCTARAVTLDPIGCFGEVPRYVTQWSDGCERLPTVHAIGGDVTAPFDDACNAVAPGPTPPWRSIGAVVDLATFAEATTTRTGSGRLQAEARTTADGHRDLLGSMFDTQLGARCWPMTSGANTGGTGSARCLPIPENASALYRDDLCTQPLFLVFKDEDCAAGYPAPGALALADTCDPRMVRVGSAFTGPKYQKQGTTCSPVDFPGRVFFEGIDDVDQAQYPTLTVVID